MIENFLINDFYKLLNSTGNDQTINANIRLNSEHPIFKGHFEQMPVLPGVCQTQIIKELLQETTQKNLILAKGDNIKFMGTIIPTQNPEISLEITYKFNENKCLTDAKIYHESTTFTKFKGEFIII